MSRLILSLILISLIVGCVDRIALYAPRRNPTPEHRAAVTAADCRGCHDPQQIKKHTLKDDCIRCHTLCRGC